VKCLILPILGSFKGLIPKFSRILLRPPKGTSFSGNVFWRPDRSRNATWVHAEESTKERKET